MVPGGSGGGIPGSGDCTGLALRCFSGRGLAKRQLNRVRVWSITRRTRLMRSQGCQRRASVIHMARRPLVGETCS